MSPLPPPPVPQRLREMLKDYPGHIQKVQHDLNKVASKPHPGVDPFDVAIWVLEVATNAFVSEARDELEVAEAGGDPLAIDRAKTKMSLMLRASSKASWLGDESLWEYFEAHREAFR